MLLLSAPHHIDRALLGPRRAQVAVGAQLLPQPGLQLYGMQRPERRKARGRFSPPPLPRTPLDRRRTRRPPPCPRRPRLWQTPPFPTLKEECLWTPDMPGSRKLVMWKLTWHYVR